MNIYICFNSFSAKDGRSTNLRLQIGKITEIPWENVVYYILDTPTQVGAFEDRLQLLHNLFHNGTNQFVVYLQHAQY